ncbi:MAG: ferrous iron transporter B [Bacteroidetes bacterium]|nr:ferrous iron transporter B [Bacteroidota bacterium]
MYKDLIETDHHIRKDELVVMLVGQPNTGKTTIFNALTHSHFSTVNYPGSTVDYSVGELRVSAGFKAQIVDTPGILSLTPHSPDEEVSVSSLFHHPEYGVPDVVVIMADATQLSRQIYLARQVRAAGFRCVMAVTMTDLLEKRGMKLDSGKLSILAGMPAIPVHGIRKQGLQELAEAIFKIYSSTPNPVIIRPDAGTIETVAEQYRVAGEIERSVIIPSGKQTLEEALRTVTPHPDETTLKLDKLLLHPVWGLVMFLVIMSGFFTAIFWLAAPLMDVVDLGFSALGTWAGSTLGTGWFSDFISGGLITGFGAVMVFVPQIMILFLLMTILEDSGYLARAAMLVDKPLAAIGLNGRSFVPLLSGFACAIPAIMAARTIPNTRERMLTILIIPLMSCSARLPVYALLLAFLIPADKPWLGGLVLTGLYLAGLISGAIVSALISKWTKQNEESSFILELPAYRFPQISIIFKNTLYKSWLYLRKAGATILVISILIWGLTYFPIPEHHDASSPSGHLQDSYAAQLGKVLEPVMQPMGFDWRVGVSLITAFAAREVFVSSLALTLNVTGDEETLQGSILSAMETSVNEKTGLPLFTTATILGLLFYFIIAMQCISTLAIARKETNGWKIPLLQLGVYTLVAYIGAVAIVQGLRLMGIA